MNRRILVAVLATGSLSLVACATKYQDMGFSGGVTAQPVMTDVYRIVARGNAYTSPTAIQDFVLMKAAETTLSVGASHFIVVGNNDRTRVDVGQTSGYSNTSVIGHTAITTYTPGSTYNIVKPGEDLMIKVIRVRPGSAPPDGAFPADDIVKTIGPRLQTS